MIRGLWFAKMWNVAERRKHVATPKKKVAKRNIWCLHIDDAVVMRNMVVAEMWKAEEENCTREVGVYVHGLIVEGERAL